VAARSEAGVEATSCSGAGEKTTVAAVARWFLGQEQSERERRDENLLSVARESAGPKILMRGT
jgi:hypothetical protein